MPKKLTHEEFVERLKVTHPNLEAIGQYVGDKIPILVRCTKHDYVFHPKPNHLHKGGNCQKCYDERRGDSLRKKPEQVLEEFRKIHGDRYQYPFIDKEYVNNKSKITMICPVHGEFKMTANKHLKGQGCDKCADAANGLRKRLTTEQFIEKAREVHGDRYDYSLVDYVTTDTPVKIICPEHGVFEQTPENHIAGGGCQKCNYSHLENMLERLLVKYDTTPQAKFPWLERKRLDFYIQDHNVGVECQGGQHFFPVLYFGGDETFETTVTRDIAKASQCDDNGVRLVFITTKKYKRYLNNKRFYGLYQRHKVLFIEDILENSNVLYETIEHEE